MSWTVGVLRSHLEEPDTAAYATAPDFWDDEPTVRVAICPRCVRTPHGCVCEWTEATTKTEGLNDG